MTTYAELLVTANAIAETYSPFEARGKGEYMITCPLHGGLSCHITVSDRILAHCFSCGADSKDELYARFKLDGFDLSLRCTDGENNKRKDKPSHLTQNNPAHQQDLDLTKLSLQDRATGEYWPVTKAYPYCDKNGQVIFYQLRADTDINPKTGKKGKILLPYGSFYNDGSKQNGWYFSIQLKPRPLYNLDKLTSNPTKPVLLFEGEKAADAGTKLFPDYVCTCYWGGMDNWSHADFTPLKGRDVTLWPDNHTKSIEAFRKVASVIEPTPKIIMENQLNDRPENWDVADDLPDGAFQHEELLKNAFMASDIRSINLGQEKEIVERLNKRFRGLLENGKMAYYDCTIPNHNGEMPYAYMNSSQVLRESFPAKVLIDNGSKKPVLMYEVDVWIDSLDKIVTYGTTFDPTTESEFIKTNSGHLLTNVFMGFDCKPILCDEKKFIYFFDHIRTILQPRDAEYLICFLAQMVQNPKTKPGIMPILIGNPATGKSIIGLVLQAVFGSRSAATMDGRTFNQKWTGHLSGKLLAFANEYTMDWRNADWLNTCLTDKMVAFEEKNRKVWYEPSYHRIIGTTNGNNFSLPHDDRRFLPMKVTNRKINEFTPSDPKNKAYFQPLLDMAEDKEALSGLHNYLKNYKITVDVFTAPATELRVSMQKPRSAAIEFVYELCRSGSLPMDFGVKIASKAFDEPNDGYSSFYPKYILRKFVSQYVKERLGFKGSGNALTSELKAFMPSEVKMMRQKFYSAGSPVEDELRDNYYTLPPLKELRRLYSSLVNPSQTWSEDDNDPLDKDTSGI